MKSIEIRAKIFELVEDKYYSTCDECVRPSDPETDISLGDAIETLMEDLGVAQYGIIITDCFDSPGYECGTVVVSWIDGDGKLDMQDIVWEVM